MVVEHPRSAFLQRLPLGVYAEVRLQSVGQSLGHHVPAVPVHDGHQVEEAPGHGQVGDVGGPHLIGPGDLGIPQQIGVDPMLGRGVGDIADADAAPS